MRQWFGRRWNGCDWFALATILQTLGSSTAGTPNIGIYAFHQISSDIFWVLHLDKAHSTWMIVCSFWCVTHGDCNYCSFQFPSRTRQGWISSSTVAPERLKVLRLRNIGITDGGVSIGAWEVDDFIVSVKMRDSCWQLCIHWDLCIFVGVDLEICWDQKFDQSHSYLDIYIYMYI